MAARDATPFNDKSMRQLLPFSHTGIEDDIIRLKHLLKTALVQIEWQPVAEPVILNLACGRADETGILIDSLAAPTHHSPLCHYIGLDRRERELNEATRRWCPQKSNDDDIEFRQANLALHLTWHQLPPAHAIMIRHQNFYDDPRVWDRILNRAISQLLPGGILILTSYFDQEHLLALASLQSIQTTVLWNARHLQSRLLDARLQKSVDRHLAIVTRVI